MVEARRICVEDDERMGRASLKLLLLGGGGGYGGGMQRAERLGLL